ncbi:rna-directed dna polymerase from mobile element jockey-like [Willisornis vidua]|uniref:Rna-directed dna polymerase from mobile element jockey-like n=1 Tax=Willisornis vidua TaxID=1566151 RepID=A0ABQ9CSC9_9PASS|nr:rna-directed dna polymerase from mobile element jockey-like [Willisornis vidua]
MVNIVLICKKGKKEDPGNYRPVSLTAVPGKGMEKITMGGFFWIKCPAQLDKHIMWWDSIMGPELFNMFINDLDTELEGILSKFADGTKLGGAVDSLKGREALQGDLDKLQDWALINHMEFNKGNCWILHLGWGSPGCSYRLGNELLECSATERVLRVQVNGKLNMSQQCPGSQEGQLCPG